MFKSTKNEKSTAAVGFVQGQWMVTVMCDDGFEDIIDYRKSVATEAEGIAYLLDAGYEEYDPNASLKAAGLVWNPVRGIYA